MKLGEGQECVGSGGGNWLERLVLDVFTLWSEPAHTSSIPARERNSKFCKVPYLIV